MLDDASENEFYLTIKFKNEIEVNFETSNYRYFKIKFKNIEWELHSIEIMSDKKLHEDLLKGKITPDDMDMYWDVDNNKNDGFLWDLSVEDLKTLWHFKNIMKKIDYEMAKAGY